MKNSLISPEPDDGIEVSDVRLKQDVSDAGVLPDGLRLYKYRYIGGDETEYVGVMAQDVLKVRPDAVSVGEDGFYRVDYAKLGTRMMTLDEWNASKNNATLSDAPSPEPLPSDSRIKRDVVELQALSPEPTDGEEDSDIRLKRDVVEVGYLLIR